MTLTLTLSRPTLSLIGSPLTTIAPGKSSLATTSSPLPEPNSDCSGIGKNDP